MHIQLKEFLSKTSKKLSVPIAFTIDFLVQKRFEFLLRSCQNVLSNTLIFPQQSKCVVVRFFGTFFHLIYLERVPPTPYCTKR